MAMTRLWKSQNDFHSHLEISHRTRDSHIPTADHLCFRSEERRMNRPQVDHFPSGRLVQFPSGLPRCPLRVEKTNASGSDVYACAFHSVINASAVAESGSGGVRRSSSVC